jgi:hypothetical protein
MAFLTRYLAIGTIPAYAVDRDLDYDTRIGSHLILATPQ